jgi:hypothetical protein
VDRANKKKNHAGRACQGDTRSLSVLWVNRMAISVKSQIETMSNKRYEIGDTLVVFFASIQNWIIRLYKFLGARTFLFLFDREFFFSTRLVQNYLYKTVPSTDLNQYNREAHNGQLSKWILGGYSSHKVSVH